MNTFSALLYADILTVKRWFITKTVSKVLVMALFFFLFFLIAKGIGAISGIFFRLLSGYEYFGMLTAGYVLHAAIFITFLLSVASSTVAAFGFLLSPGAGITYMYTLPVDFSKVAVWIFIKTIAVNMLLLACMYMPVLWSFALAFDMAAFGFFLRGFGVLFFLVVVSASVGTIFSLFVSRIARGNVYTNTTTGFLLFFTAIAGALKIIFPPQMEKLYDASPTDFQTLFSSLPLNSHFLPGFWLSQILTGSGSLLQGIGLLLLLGITLSISLRSWRRVLHSQLQNMYSSPFSESRIVRKTSFYRYKFPLVAAELLGILRNPKEMGYGIFLMALSFFFFAALAVLGMEGRWLSYKAVLSVFAYSWFLFFMTAVLLRFVFPSMSREGSRFWYCFSLPLSRSQLVRNKFFFACLFILPVVVLAGAISILMPFMSGVRGLLFFVSMLSGIMLIVVHAGSGIIFPDFDDGEDADRVSTTFGGLFTFFLSIGVAVWSGWQLYRVLINPAQLWYAVTEICIVYLSFTAVLWIVSKRAIESYEQ